MPSIARVPGRALRAVLLIVLATCCAAAAVAGDAPPPLLDYRTQGWFLPRSPGAAGGPAAGLFNPGAFAMNDQGGSDLWYDDARVDGLDNYGFAFGRSLNFAMNATTWGTHWANLDHASSIPRDHSTLATNPRVTTLSFPPSCHTARSAEATLGDGHSSRRS